MELTLASITGRHDNQRRTNPPAPTQSLAAINRAAAKAAAGEGATTSTPANAAQAAPQLHPEVLGTIGEEIAHNLTQALDLILQAASNPRAMGESLSRTHFLVDRLRRKAMSMQQIARLAQNRVRQSHEKLSLAGVAQNVLDDRKTEYAATGLVVNTRFKTVEIIVDPGLLMSLISASLDWVTEFGTVVRMSTSMKLWPQHGQLNLIAAQGVRTQEDIDRKTTVNQSIAWHLMQQIALSMGVGLVMDETVHERSLTIEFPRTVVALEGMTVMEMEMETGHSGLSGQSGFGSVSTNFIAGHQVLVISADYRLFVEVREICAKLSLRCEHAATVQVAERYCEGQVPHLIVCDEAQDDDIYAALLDDLQRHSPGFPTIIVTEGGYGFEFSDWSGNSKSKVARKHLTEQLPSALTVELSRAM